MMQSTMMQSTMMQTPALPRFTEVELLELLATLDEMDSVGAEDVKMEEQTSVWDPSVNVVLAGDTLTSEDDFENFIKSLAPGETGVSAALDVFNSSGVGTKQTPSPLAAQQPKRCRKTNKQQINHLRAVAAEMEKKLKELNQIRNQDISGSDPFWKRVSSRLLEERQRSAKENARLRDLVLQQMSTLQAVQRSLKKSPALSQNDVFPEMEEQAVAPCESKELYRDLFRNLSILYSTGVDRILQKPRETSPSFDGNKKVNIEIKTDSHDGLHMCLQVVEAKLISSSFEKVREKAWKILTGTNGHEGFELMIQNQGDKMFGWCKLDSAIGPMQMLGNVAVRQFVEANKLTIVWECEGNVHQGDSKKRIQPKGWCVFEPVEGDPANATIFRRYAILSPIISDDTNAERSIGTTTEFVLENYKRTVVFIFDSMLASLNNS